MATTETVLAVYSDRGRRGLPLEGVYRQLFRQDLYLRAYGRIYRNAGAMTPGVTGETVDAMSLAKIERIIDALRRETYRWSPAWRTYVPKKNGKQRPLGVPTWSDKLVQEAIRLLFEAYYEPHFSDCSHGFRPGRGCHTALQEITRSWRGVKWFLEGDSKGCYDNIDHQVLLSILAEDIHDKRFIRLLSNMLQAGYLETWRYHETLSGTPQGSIASPILANVYLNRLDRFVEQTLLPTFNRGDQRRPNPAYQALLNAARKAGDRGEHARAKQLRHQAQALPSRDPNDPDFRRLKYVRYADDTLLGFSGPRAEAEEIKRQLSAFLREELRLELSAEKTLITHARTHAARFLGFEVVALAVDHKHDRRGQRCLNGAVRLKVPQDVIVARCRPYMRQGKAVHRPERLVDDDCSIVKQYQAEYGGFVQYYLLAMNAHCLRRVYHVIQTSLLGTLANKHKTKVGTIRRRMQKMVKNRGHTLKALVIEKPRGEGKKPLVAMFGGISLRWNKHARVLDHPKPVYSGRSEVVQRLLAEVCEVCGSVEGPFEVHHVRRLADLDRPREQEKPLWVKRMAARHRKTLVTCRRCHHEIHRDHSGWRKKTRHWKAG